MIIKTYTVELMVTYIDLIGVNFSRIIKLRLL